MRKQKESPLIEFLGECSESFKLKGFKRQPWNKRYPWSTVFTGNKKYPKLTTK